MCRTTKALWVARIDIPDASVVIWNPMLSLIMKEQEFNRLYADLLTHVLALRPGERLIIRGEVAFWDFYCVLAENAYKKGAKHVDIWPLSEELSRIRLDTGDPEHFSYLPQEYEARYKQAVDDGAAFIRISTTPDPFVFKGVNTQHLETIMKTYSAQRCYLLGHLMADHNKWLVASYPCEAWARVVLGDEAGRDDLSALLQPILFGPDNDPIPYWEAKSKMLEKRSAILNDYNLESLHIRGGGTDLTIGLSDRAIWTGGNSYLVPGGTPFLPNLPTEEVFTAPDWRKTNGVARTSRSVILQGNEVAGAEFRFEQGKLLSWNAEKGKDVLDSYFNTDEGSRRLGEIALVGCESPVFQANRLFYDTLLDENAAVHIAFGAGYETNLQDNEAMSDAQKDACGLSRSNVHEDVMIGCLETEIIGKSYSGEEHVLMKQGRVCV